MKTDLNQALCDALGVDTKGKDVAEVTLRLVPHELPRVTITQYFKLVPLDEPQPLDLDAMADAARRRVARAIEECADRHLAQMGGGRRGSLGLELIVDSALVRQAIREASDQAQKLYFQRLGAIAP